MPKNSLHNLFTLVVIRKLVELYVNLYTRVGTVTLRVNAKHARECLSELGAHGAVEDEVHRAVDEYKDVPDVAEGHVDVVEDSLIDGTGQRQHTLRQLGQNERQDDDDEHQSRTTVADVVRRKTSTSWNNLRRRTMKDVVRRTS